MLGKEAPLPPHVSQPWVKVTRGIIATQACPYPKALHGQIQGAEGSSGGWWVLHVPDLCHLSPHPSDWEQRCGDGSM